MQLLRRIDAYLCSVPTPPWSGFAVVGVTACTLALVAPIAEQDRLVLSLVGMLLPTFLLVMTRLGAISFGLTGIALSTDAATGWYYLALGCAVRASIAAIRTLVLRGNPFVAPEVPIATAAPTAVRKD